MKNYLALTLALSATEAEAASKSKSKAAIAETLAAVPAEPVAAALPDEPTFTVSPIQLMEFCKSTDETSMDSTLIMDTAGAFSHSLTEAFKITDKEISSAERENERVALANGIMHFSDSNRITILNRFVKLNHLTIKADIDSDYSKEIEEIDTFIQEIKDDKKRIEDLVDFDESGGMNLKTGTLDIEKFKKNSLDLSFRDLSQQGFNCPQDLQSFVYEKRTFPASDEAGREELLKFVESNQDKSLDELNPEETEEELAPNPEIAPENSAKQLFQKLEELRVEYGYSRETDISTFNDLMKRVHRFLLIKQKQRYENDRLEAEAKIGK